MFSPGFRFLLFTRPIKNNSRLVTRFMCRVIVPTGSNNNAAYRYLSSATRPAPVIYTGTVAGDAEE